MSNVRIVRGAQKITDSDTTVYDELVNNGDVLPKDTLWYKSPDTFTIPQIEEDPTGNILNKFADFMSINSNAAKDTDYNFCVTCGLACNMTNDGHECPKCGIVKHSVGDFKDVHDDSMKILNFGGRKLYSIVDYSKTQKKNVLGQLLQLNDNKPNKYNRHEILITPVKTEQTAPQTPENAQTPQNAQNAQNTTQTPENTQNAQNTTQTPHDTPKDNMPKEYDDKSEIFGYEDTIVLSDSMSSELVFDSESSETPAYEISANSAPCVIGSTEKQQTTVTIFDSSVITTANSLQEPSIRFPKAVLEKAADYYNMIQKVSIDQIDLEGKICGQKRIVRRGDVKDEVIGYCIYCACVEMGMPRKEKEIAKFMRIKNNGLSRGKNFVRRLYCAGKINIPALDIDANDYYVKRYLTNLKLYNDDSNIAGLSGLITERFHNSGCGSENPIFGDEANPPNNSIFMIYKNYLDTITTDTNAKNNQKLQQEQYDRNNKFVLKLVEESTRLGIGNNSNHISKIVGSIWVLICHLDLALEETPTRKKAESQQSFATGDFSYDNMYSKQTTPLIMNYEQAMSFAKLHNSEIVWCGKEHDKSLQFVAIFAKTKHLLIAGSLFESQEFSGVFSQKPPQKPPQKPHQTTKSKQKNAKPDAPEIKEHKISLTDLENACDGIRKNTFLKFSKCVEDNILLFIDVFNEFNIPHKVKGKLIKRKKNTKGIIDQLYRV